MRKNTGISVKETPQADLGNVWPPFPPAGETELEKALRLQEEAKAANYSAKIDEAIEQNRLESQKQRRRQVHILLLGQAESGKSTILKNFQLQFAPKAFRLETEAWLAVIHLNLVCSVNLILERISSQAPGGKVTATMGVITPDDELRKIKMKLAPLREVEDILSQRLSADKTAKQRPSGANPDIDIQVSDVFVRSGSGWKSLRSHPARLDQLNKTRQIIEACKEDIVSLWNHPAVRAVVVDLKFLQEQAAFFLADALRVLSADYEPMMEDILRARLGTMGVEEHRIVLETLDKGMEYVIYDVGGSRSQRAAWASYFDNVTVIIFLVPISAFNQVLTEDATVNRLSDSFQLWRIICSSKLLSNIPIILLLNKFDLLAEKLNSGIIFGKHVTSYKGKTNDPEHVAKYLKAKFKLVHEQSAHPRDLYSYITCAIDIKATSHVIMQIRDVLLLSNLADSDLI